MVAGALLLLNKWKGFALIFAAIISVNIVLFHLVLDPASVGPAALIAVLNTILMYAYWDNFKSLF